MTDDGKISCNQSHSYGFKLFAFEIWVKYLSQLQSNSEYKILSQAALRCFNDD